MKNRANLLFLAVVVAAIGAIGMYRYLESRDAELRAARAALASASSVPVIVATRPIAIGTTLAAADVTVVEWPADAVPPATLSDPAGVVGKVVRTNLDVMQAIRENNLADQGFGLMPMLIEQGKRAVSVRVDRETGVSGFVTPNSYVDVLATGMVRGDGKGERRVKMILQNVRVLATGKSTAVENNEPVEVPTVTLLVTPDEAERLTLATQENPVRLALRSFEDAAPVKTAGLTVDELLDDGAAGLPTQQPPLLPAAANREVPSIEVFLGETKTKMNY